MANKRVKVGITGAAGQIGYALLFRIASGQMFGLDTEVELQLLELEQAMDALHGVAMELDDCAFPLLKNITCTSDLNTAFSGVNWALLVGSVPRKKGMLRGDLLEINGGIFTSQGKAINDNAADDAKIFVVGNPCNTNCLIAMNSSPDIPKDRFYAMTTLDELRAKTQLAKKANVDVTEVTNMTIWGNHSATQFPDFENVQISGKAAPEIITDTAWLQNDFISTVQQRGAAIIKARGASSAASAANAVVQGVNHLLFDTPANDTYSMCKVSQGEYGIDEGLIFSFPCRTEGGVCQVVQDVKHDAFGQEKIETTHTELKQERDTVTELGLIE